VPGRLRLRSTRFKRDPRCLDRARQLVARIEGVHFAEARPRTGSLVVRYHPGVVHGARVLDGLNAGGFIELARIVIEESHSRSGRHVHDLASFALGAILQLLLDRGTLGLFRALR
jgi:hypothetical protein